MTASSGAEWRVEPGNSSVERLWLNGQSTSNTRRSAEFVAVPSERVTTLAEVPGHQIVRVIGAITELSATSGFTAATKGNAALDNAMSMLRGTAAERGANAIVGLSASVFGAKGGVTGVLGGDAVGVLLIGTAVVVRPLEPVE